MNKQPLNQGAKLLKNLYRLGVASLLSLAFFIASTMQVAASPQVTFNANPATLGPIPDSTSSTCRTPGPPLDIQFAVSGLTSNVQSASVSITLTHTYVGDLVATLIPPSGGNGFLLFGYVGDIGPTGPGGGDNSNLSGTYVFTDAASRTLWQAAADAAGSGDVIAPGSYRTTSIGGSTSGGAPTSLNAAVAGLTSAQANGTWTLRITDGCADDTGTVTAAVLDLTTQTSTPVAAKPFFDYFGTGKSSFGVIGASGSNFVWRVLINGATTGPTTDTVLWGLVSDFPTPGYFDADNRADIGVWRPSTTAGESRFFIRNTNPVSLNVIAFGSAGDFAGYDADYDGDGRDDPTTIRRVNGQWLWSYRASSTNVIRSIPFGIATGAAGSAPGSNGEDIPFYGADYSGDGRADIVVIRQNASGAETWYWGDSVTGQVLGGANWGESATDFFVHGDFLGDSRFDFAVWRAFGAGTDGIWYIRENGGNGFVARQFGIPGAANTRDIPVAGDFGGDAKNDIAVYRPSNNTFYWLNSTTTNTLSFQTFGQPGDIPVGRLRVY